MKNKLAPCILAFFHVLRALATTEKTLRHAAGAQARAYLHEEACTVARHPPPLASRAALRLW